jgi:integrase
MSVLDFDTAVERTLAAIDDSDDITDANAELLQEYHRDRVLNGIGSATQQKNTAYLKKVAEYAGETSLNELTQDDVRGIVGRLHDRDLAASTVSTYKEIIRLFWLWMSGEDDADDVEEIAWMERNGSHGNDTLPKDLLTKEDVRAQSEAANNQRDQALIAMLYETGARIGELIDLTVGDIEDRKRGKKVVVEGKTGSRRIPLVESVPNLNKSLNEHPNPKKDATASPTPPRVAPGAGRPPGVGSGSNPADAVQLGSVTGFLGRDGDGESRACLYRRPQAETEHARPWGNKPGGGDVRRSTSGALRGRRHDRRGCGRGDHAGSRATSRERPGFGPRRTHHLPTPPIF